MSFKCDVASAPVILLSRTCIRFTPRNRLGVTGAEPVSISPGLLRSTRRPAVGLDYPIVDWGEAWNEIGVRVLGAVRRLINAVRTIADEGPD